jgi:hypothetical protein
VTHFFVPDLKADDLAKEDEKFKAYLVSKRWHGEMNEDDLKALADEGVPQTMVEDGKRA